MRQLQANKDSLDQTYDDQKMNLWELEGHIKKVRKLYLFPKVCFITIKMFK